MTARSSSILFSTTKAPELRHSSNPFAKMSIFFENSLLRSWWFCSMYLYMKVVASSPKTFFRTLSIILKIWSSFLVVGSKVTPTGYHIYYDLISVAVAMLNTQTQKTTSNSILTRNPQDSTVELFHAALSQLKRPPPKQAFHTRHHTRERP